MKKLYSLVLAVTLICTLPVQALASTALLGGVATPSVATQAEQQGIVAAMSALRNAQAQVREIELDIELERAKTIPQVEEVQSIDAEIASVFEEQSKLAEQKATTIEPDEIAQIEELEAYLNHQLAELESRREQLRAEVADKQQAQQDLIVELETSLAEARDTVVRWEKQVSDKTWQLMTQASVFIGVLLVIILLRLLVATGINRINNLPYQRRETLLRINEVTSLILIGLTFAVALFSQFVNFLPILAILGTALAFALRGIITSFIGWFVIGTGNGYKVGDLIEVGENRGRVIDITPLLTQMRQTGLRGDTGRIMTIPNNAIFEQAVVNYSKMYRFTYLMLDFLISENSDLEKAKAILMMAIVEMNTDQDDVAKNAMNLQNAFGLRLSNLEPKVYLEPDPRGILLRGKFMCRLDNRFQLRSDITHAFLHMIQKEKNINLRFVETGL